MFGKESLQAVDLCTSALAVSYTVCPCMVQGLEGRSNNPVSLLMDTLNHPCADLGLELPSLLEWRRHPECQVDHIVLGKGPPGGSWQVILRKLVIVTKQRIISSYWVSVNSVK